MSLKLRELSVSLEDVSLYCECDGKEGNGRAKQLIRYLKLWCRVPIYLLTSRLKTFNKLL